MIDRRQRAVGIGAELHRLARGAAVADRAVHVLAAQHQLDRAAHQLGRHDAEDLRTGHQALGAESTAEERGAHVDVLRLETKQAGDAPLCDRHALARRVEEQRLAVPSRDHRVRLHRVVILRRRLDDRLDALRGARQTGGDVTGPRLGRHAGSDRLGLEGLAIETDHRLLDIVAVRQQRSALLRRFERPADDHRDRLVGVAHHIVLQEVELEVEATLGGIGVLGELRRVVGRHHLDDVGMRLGGLDVEVGHAALGDAGHAEHGVQHALGVMVGGVAGGTGHLEEALAAGHGLAHRRAVADAGLRHGGELPGLRRRARPAGPVGVPACRRRRA